MEFDQQRKPDADNLIAENLELVARLDTDAELVVGNEYTVSVGVKDPTGNQSVGIDITIHTDGSVELTEPVWIKRTVSDSEATPVTFGIRSKGEGVGKVTVDAYYHQHWLTYIVFDLFSKIQNEK